MARDYAIVTPRFWTGDTGRRLRGRMREQLVAAYLMTGPSANMIGLYYLPIPTLAHEVGIPREGALEALRRLSKEGFAYYDDDQEVVWVPEMGRHQVAETLTATDNRVTGVVREAIKYRKCRFYQDFVEHYRGPWNLPSMPSGEGPPSPSEGPSKPLRSQDQDQDQDHSLSPPPARARASEGTESTRPDVEAEAPPREVERGQPGGSDPAAWDGGDAAPAGIAGEPRGAAGPTPPLTPREQGERDRLAILAPKTLTAELIAELERRGFECWPPPKAATEGQVERAVAEVGVQVAAERVMAIVVRDRSLRVVPRDTLGWYLDAIRGQPEGGSRSAREALGGGRQVGPAAPSPASAFVGGERELS